MTPHEKAKELVEKFLPLTKAFASHTGWIDDLPEAKKAAIICVGEILSTDDADIFTNWWKEVKQEIEKL